MSAAPENHQAPCSTFTNHLGLLTASLFDFIIQTNDPFCKLWDAFYQEMRAGCAYKKTVPVDLAVFLAKVCDRETHSAFDRAWTEYDMGTRAAQAVRFRSAGVPEDLRSAFLSAVGKYVAFKYQIPAGANPTEANPTLLSPVEAKSRKDAARAELLKVFDVMPVPNYAHLHSMDNVDWLQPLVAEYIRTSLA